VDIGTTTYCYYRQFVAGGLDFGTAERTCGLTGGVMATLNTAEEMALYKRFMTSEFTFDDEEDLGVWIAAARPGLDNTFPTNLDGSTWYSGAGAIAYPEETEGDDCSMGDGCCVALVGAATPDTADKLTLVDCKTKMAYICRGPKSGSLGGNIKIKSVMAFDIPNAAEILNDKDKLKKFEEDLEKALAFAFKAARDDVRATNFKAGSIVADVEITMAPGATTESANKALEDFKADPLNKLPQDFVNGYEVKGVSVTGSSVVDTEADDDDDDDLALALGLGLGLGLGIPLLALLIWWIWKRRQQQVAAPAAGPASGAPQSA